MDAALSDAIRNDVNGSMDSSRCILSSHHLYLHRGPPTLQVALPDVCYDAYDAADEGGHGHLHDSLSSCIFILGPIKARQLIQEVIMMG